MTYNLTNINDKAQLTELYKHSTATILGAGGPIEDWINGIQKWLKENNYGTTTDFYVCTGSLVNNTYDLKGDNRFPDDLVILSYDLIENKETYGKYCIDRLQKGIRWFDDIIDNSIEEPNDD